MNLTALKKFKLFFKLILQISVAGIKSIFIAPNGQSPLSEIKSAWTNAKVAQEQDTLEKAFRTENEPEQIEARLRFSGFLRIILYGFSFVIFLYPLALVIIFIISLVANTESNVKSPNFLFAMGFFVLSLFLFHLAQRLRNARSEDSPIIPSWFYVFFFLGNLALLWLLFEYHRLDLRDSGPILFLIGLSAAGYRSNIKKLKISKNKSKNSCP